MAPTVTAGETSGNGGFECGVAGGATRVTWTVAGVTSSFTVDGAVDVGEAVEMKAAALTGRVTEGGCNNG